MRLSELAAYAKEHEFIHLLNVFLLVLVRHLNVLTAWLQLNANRLSKTLVFRREGQF